MDKNRHTSETIRNALAHRAGEAPDASAIAEATLTAWHQMSVRLAPVIGVRGVNALFNRSLYLTTIAFPWLVITGDKEDSALLLATFRARLKTQEASVAAEASYVLLISFTELLETLIGESLTDRLLGTVWASPSPASEQEPSS